MRPPATSTTTLAVTEMSLTKTSIRARRPHLLKAVHRRHVRATHQHEHRRHGAERDDLDRGRVVTASPHQDRDEGEQHDQQREAEPDDLSEQALRDRSVVSDLGREQSGRAKCRQHDRHCPDRDADA